MEPAYSFTLPSIEDDITLNCRLYHPGDLFKTLSVDEHGTHGVRGAVIAHPYAPLGGSHDDVVLLNVAKSLIEQGYLVVTFNFRGAGGSQGSTSWSGKGEKEDYVTVVGFMLHHLCSLNRQEFLHEVDVLASADLLCSTDLILSGYSYGSLILSKLPPIETIVQRFKTAAIGTSAAEVVLRARRLAAETYQTVHELEKRKKPRGRAISAVTEPKSSPSRSRAHSLTVTIGGEETNASERRPSPRESHRPIELVKKSVEVPRRLRMHLRRRSSSKSEDESSKNSQRSSISAKRAIDVNVRYLLISPLLGPLAHALVPPSHLSHIFGHYGEAKDLSTGFGALEHPTLLLWGGEDGFTSSRKLKQWVDKLKAVAPDVVQGVEIEPAGHFWREQGVMKQLLQHITAWINASASQH